MVTRIMAEMAFREVHALCQDATGNGQDSMERLRKILQIVRDVDFRTHEMGENKAGRYRQALYFIANASHQTGDEIAKYAQERLVEIDDDLKETRPMTAPPKMPREPFTPPFHCDEDRQSRTVLDANGVSVTTWLPSLTAQWLCDRLNATAPAEGERAAFEAWAGSKGFKLKPLADSTRENLKRLAPTYAPGDYEYDRTQAAWEGWQGRNTK